MTAQNCALRLFLKDADGAMSIDMTVTLGDSIWLALAVSGVVSDGALMAANDVPRAARKAEERSEAKRQASGTDTGATGETPDGKRRVASGSRGRGTTR